MSHPALLLDGRLLGIFDARLQWSCQEKPQAVDGDDPKGSSFSNSRTDLAAPRSIQGRPVGSDLCRPPQGDQLTREADPTRYESNIPQPRVLPSRGTWSGIAVQCRQG